MSVSFSLSVTERVCSVAFTHDVNNMASSYTHRYCFIQWSLDSVFVSKNRWLMHIFICCDFVRFLRFNPFYLTIPLIFPLLFLFFLSTSRFHRVVHGGGRDCITDLACYDDTWSVVNTSWRGSVFPKQVWNECVERHFSLLGIISRRRTCWALNKACLLSLCPNVVERLWGLFFSILLSILYTLG